MPRPRWAQALPLPAQRPRHLSQWVRPNPPPPGYEDLGQPWLSYSRIARHYVGGAAPEDREDLVQDIILTLAQVARKRGGLSPGKMLKTARFAWLAYLRDKARRRHPVSLNRPIDRDGQDGRELWETLADRTARDMDAYLDAQAQLQAQAPRAIELAAKKIRGEPLTSTEHCWLSGYRRRGDPPQPTPDTGLPRFADLIAQGVGQLPHMEGASGDGVSGQPLGGEILPGRGQGQAVAAGK